MAIKKLSKKHKTPRGRLVYNRFVKDFDPYNPKKELLDELKEWRTPKSGYISPAKRDIRLNDMDFETAEYIGYTARMGREDIRILARLRYFILLAMDEDVTPIEVKEMLYDEELGLKGKE